MSKWISVSDTIPKDDTPVHVKQLYRFKRYKPSSSQYRHGMVGRWQSWNGYAWSNCENGCGWSNCENPTHWMPLPKLPSQ